MKNPSKKTEGLDKARKFIIENWDLGEEYKEHDLLSMLHAMVTYANAGADVEIITGQYQTQLDHYKRTVVDEVKLRCDSQLAHMKKQHEALAKKYNHLKTKAGFKKLKTKYRKIEKAITRMGRTILKGP